MGAKRKNHTTQNDRRQRNYSKIEDIGLIRDEAVKFGLNFTTRRWAHKYPVPWIEDIVFFRIHKSILSESAQYEADLD